MLTRRRAQLSADVSSIRDLNEKAETGANRRTEVARRLGTVDRELEVLGDEFTAISLGPKTGKLKEALSLRLLTRRTALEAETAALRAELQALSAQREVLPLRKDLQRRRIEREWRNIALIGETADRLRHEEAREALQLVREQCAEFRRRIPSLVALASETEPLAHQLWSAEGLSSL